MFKKLFFILPATMLIFGSAPAQEKAAETSSEVPELAAFHDVIYPIWHTAYPEKDYAALRSYVKDVNAGAEKIYGAKLPGILRDREARWKAGLEEFKKAVEAYGTAAEGKDDALLLTAAETLHSRYEKLVRLIRPLLPEVDEFHKVLYVIYHTYLPNKEFEKIRGTAGDLEVKAEAITTAKLSRRLENKAAEFKEAAGNLHESAKKLSAACQASDQNAIEAAVNEVHMKYQALEKVGD
jgi:hypothetical protein